MTPLISLEGLKLLVIEDDPDSRDLLRTLLINCGAEVKTAASAREAHQAFLQAVPDVLISDIEMPEEDGYSLIRKIRELPTGRWAPAIALTAHANAAARMQALAAGFDTHVAKPIEPAELLTVISSLSKRNRNGR